LGLALRCVAGVALLMVAFMVASMMEPNLLRAQEGEPRRTVEGVATNASYEERLLDEWKISRDERGLQKLLQERCWADRTLKRVTELIQDLGNDELTKRDRSEQQLINLGSVALVQIKRAEK